MIIFKSATGVVLLLALAGAQAACPSVPTASRFVLNGSEATDQSTGLTWARCSAGQTWSGATCTGTAKLFSQTQGLQEAQATSGWRLPNVKELSSLVDRGCQEPAIDTTAFPNTPSSDFSSSSPRSGDSGNAWFVDFELGVVTTNSRSIVNKYVRLVRASQ